jgi:predicted RNA-binding protein with PIN domain
MTGGVTVLVDARNVLRSEWPNRSEREIAELCCAWAAREGHRAVVVFDGNAPRVAAAGDCAVIGTGAETADERLERLATELAADRRPYWLITSDRALRAAAGREAVRVVGGGAFLGLIGSAPGRAGA